MTLGLKSEMKKWEAQKKLQEIIDSVSDSSNVAPSPACTMKWFWEQRYRPLKEPIWKASSAPKMVYFINRYVVEPFADIPLADLNRFALQKHLNGLAAKFSRSVIVNFRTYAKAVLDEAVEQEFLSRNPAARLNFRKPGSPVGGF